MLFVQIFDLCQINERGKNMTILKTENLKKYMAMEPMLFVLWMG